MARTNYTGWATVTVSLRISVVNITDSAAARIKLLRSALVAPPAGLRIAVRGGGCSGLTLDISWAPEVKENDKVFEKDGQKVLIDPKSYLYVSGSELDYVDTLAASGFKLNNPNAKSSCGCGESFST